MCSSDTYLLSLPDKNQIKWLPILQCGKTESRMGILEDGDWAVEARGRLYRLNEPRSYISAMALLELPIKTIHQNLTEFFESIEVKFNVNELFPFEQIIRTGFEQGSEYWAELAFNWYQEVSQEIKYSLMDSISNVVNAKWASQTLRQKAKQEVRKMEAQK
jgi:hypothetical protein